MLVHDADSHDEEADVYLSKTNKKKQTVKALLLAWEACDTHKYDEQYRSNEGPDEVSVVSQPATAAVHTCIGSIIQSS